ncbi:unnamed protein product [Camellia sinensis]
MGKDEKEMRGEIKETLVNEEHKIWKINTQFLYDLVITYALEWPFLTVEWLPDLQEPLRKNYSVQKMILRTHIFENEPNYLMLAQVQLHLQDADNDARHYDDNRSDFGGFGSSNGKLHIWDLRTPSAGKPIQSTIAHQSEKTLLMMHVQSTMKDINKEELGARTSSNLLVGEKPINKEEKQQQQQQQHETRSQDYAAPKTAMELEQASSITYVQTAGISG